MLFHEQLKAFIPTTKRAEAKIFYCDVLGLVLLAEDEYAIEFNANGVLLRVASIPVFTPHAFTVLGWNVEDIISKINSLNSHGIFCEKYSFLPQNDLGIWVSPNGSQVAWFKDPDENILSLTQLPSTINEHQKKYLRNTLNN